MRHSRPVAFVLGAAMLSVVALSGRWAYSQAASNRSMICPIRFGASSRGR